MTTSRFNAQKTGITRTYAVRDNGKTVETTGTYPSAHRLAERLNALNEANPGQPAATLMYMLKKG